MIDKLLNAINFESMFIWQCLNRAWLTIGNEDKIPQYSHKGMHQKKVTVDGMTVYPLDNDQHLSSENRKWQCPLPVGIDCVGEEVSHNSAWEFDGYIKSVILNRSQWHSASQAVRFCMSLSEVPPVIQTCRVVYPVCAFLRLSLSTDTGVTPAYGRTNKSNLSWMILLHTSVNWENKKYLYIYYSLSFVWPEWKVTYTIWCPCQPSFLQGLRT